jgi:hypothetical protein
VLPESSYRLMIDKSELHFEVQGRDIVVSMPGTKFMVAYQKLNDA